MNHIQKMLSVMVCLIMAAPCSLYSKVDTTAQILTRAENAVAILAKNPNNYQAAQDLLLAQKLLPKQAAKINTLIQKSSQSVEQLKKTVEREIEKSIKEEFPELSTVDINLDKDIMLAINDAESLLKKYQLPTELNLQEAQEAQINVNEQINLLIKQKQNALGITNLAVKAKSKQLIDTASENLIAIANNITNHIKNLSVKIPDAPIELDNPIKSTKPVQGDNPTGNTPAAPVRPLSDNELLNIIKKSYEEFKTLESELDNLLKVSKSLIPSAGFLGFLKNDPEIVNLRECLKKINDFDAKIVTAKKDNTATNATLQSLLLSKNVTNDKVNEARINTINSVYGKHKELIGIKAQLQAALEQKEPEKNPAAPAELSTELKEKIAFAISELKALKISDITALVQEKDALIENFEKIKDVGAHDGAQAEKIILIEKIGKVNNLKQETPFFNKTTAVTDALESQMFTIYKTKALQIINDYLNDKNFPSASQKIKAIAAEYNNTKEEINNLKKSIDELDEESKKLQTLIETELTENRFNVNKNETTNEQLIKTIEKHLADIKGYKNKLATYKNAIIKYPDNSFNSVLDGFAKTIGILEKDVPELQNKLNELRNNKTMVANAAFDKEVAQKISEIETSLKTLNKNVSTASGLLIAAKPAAPLTTLNDGQKKLATDLGIITSLIQENNKKNTNQKDDNHKKLTELRQKIESLQKLYEKDIKAAETPSSKPVSGNPQQDDDYGYSKYTTYNEFNDEANNLFSVVIKSDDASKMRKKIELRPKAKSLYTTLKDSKLFVKDQFNVVAILNNLNKTFDLSFGKI